MNRASWDGGWWHGARRIDSPNHGPRPPGVLPTLIVLHSISLPPGEYGGDAIERLFTNRLDPTEHPSFGPLQGLHVSAHFLIRRTGRVEQYVACERRAWHAGRSIWRGVADLNDRSIGIELEGLEGRTFEASQYLMLCRLIRLLAGQHRIGEVVGHEHVAPGRKADPGPGFDWTRLAGDLGWPRSRFGPWALRHGHGNYPND